MSSETNTSRSVTSTVRNSMGDSRASWLLIVGVVLFVIPEPITSFLGVLLITLGIVAWLLGSVL